MLTRDAILASMQRRTTTESSIVFGGAMRVRELLRSEYREAQAAARNDAVMPNDRFNAMIFATAVIDDAGGPLFTADDVLLWPERSVVWNEVLRIAQLALDLSEVGTDALKKPSSASPETTDVTP